MSKGFSLVALPRLGLSLFFFFFAISIFFYSGGTINDPNTLGYSFSRNFFSDLGIVDKDNMISVVFFALALLICGLTFTIYYYNFLSFFTNETFDHTMGRFGCLVGILGAIFFIIVGFTPHNYVIDPHVFVVKWAFRCFLITSISFTYVFFKDDRFSTQYGIGYILFAIFILFYILIMEFGPDPNSGKDFDLIFNVISQKIIVLIFALSILFQSFENSKLVSKYFNNH